MTMVEALVAASILAGGLLAVMRTVQISIRAQMRSEVHATAARLALEKMEEIRNQPQIAVGEESGDFEDNFPEFRWEIRISEGEMPGLFEVLAIITYDFQEQEHEYTLSALQRETGAESATEEGGAAF
jgi:type II secretory pathway pseudopilin PulG